MQQITVQKLWPLEGKPNGGFKGTDGKTYKCDAATYGRLQEGMTFESNVKPSEWQGKTFYWLPKNFTPDNNTVGAIIPQPAQNGHASASPPRPTANGTQFRTPKEMFQSEVVVAALSTGKWDVFADLDDILRKAGEAWDMRG